MTSYDENIKKVYQKYFSEMNLTTDGLLKEPVSNQIDPVLNQIWNRRFTTYPYIGKKYGEKTPKLLFIGIDAGMDFGKTASIEERRLQIERLFTEENFLNKSIDMDMHFDINKGEMEFKGKRGLAPNPHMLGTMLTALKHYNKELWNEISNRTINELKQPNIRNRLLQENPIPYIALTNAYKYNTRDRKNRKGSQDNIFLSFIKDLNLLLDEITILNPDIIIMQSKELCKDSQIMMFLNSSGKKVILGYHPSCFAYSGFTAEKLERKNNELLKTL